MRIRSGAFVRGSFVCFRSEAKTLPAGLNAFRRDRNQRGSIALAYHTRDNALFPVNRANSLSGVLKSPARGGEHREGCRPCFKSACCVKMLRLRL
jgi:hypothetical protein